MTGSKFPPPADARSAVWQLGLVLLLAGGLAAAGAPPERDTPESAAPAPHSAEISPWLDEVRAQRQAWEGRRETVRERFEFRRRLYNPRGAVQQEAWEDDARRRRAARIERMDQNRDFFLGTPPGQYPLPWGAPAPSDSGAQPAFAPPPFPPSGWDNLWYFRGF